MAPQNVHDLVLRSCDYLKAQKGEVPGLSDGPSVTTKVLMGKDMRRQWKMLLLQASKMEEGTGSQGASRSGKSQGTGSPESPQGDQLRRHLGFQPREMHFGL